MRFNAVAVLAVLSLPASIAAKDPEPPKPPRPCTVKSSTSGSFFDLSSLTLQTIGKDEKADETHREKSWPVNGYDYKANFSMNLCAPVVEELHDVQALPSSQRANVSAFYTRDGKTISIGSVNTVPVFRGRKMVLTYTGGSECPIPTSKRSVHLDSRKTTNDDDDDDDDDDDRGSGRKDNKLRRSTIISFLCNRDSTAPKLALSFVGSTDDCSYFFEARTAMACEGATADSQGDGVGPGGVFGLIVLITVAAYILGGIAYQRTVMHQRGWKQLPNYALWASVWYFIKDFTVAIFSSCSRLLPSRKGYNQLPASYSDRSRSRRNEDENRLIDQLDEEWDD